MITMHARPRQTDRRTDGHHDNSATIRCKETHRALTTLVHNYDIHKMVSGLDAML